MRPFPCFDFNVKWYLNQYIYALHHRQELSGDLMDDFSTPLLDSVNNKLVDPALDCKSLAYNSTLVSGESSTVSDQQNLMSAEAVQEKVPTVSPTTPAPTMPLECSPDETGPRQHNGCTGE